MAPTVRLPNDSERNDAAQRSEPFAWSDFFPQFLPSTFRELAVKNFSTPLGKRRVGNVYLGLLSPGRATTGLKPKSTICCPKRKQESRLRPNIHTNAQRLTSIAASARLPPMTTSLLGLHACALHNATHITQHTKKNKSKKGGIRNKPDINRL